MGPEVCHRAGDGIKDYGQRFLEMGSVPWPCVVEMDGWIEKEGHKIVAKFTQNAVGRRMK